VGRGKKKPHRAPHPTPTGLRPQHPERDGTEWGSAQQQKNRRQREGRQRVTRKPRSEHTRPGRHSVVRHRSSNQDNKSGNNGTNSITLGARTVLQEGEMIQEPGHVTNPDRFCIKRVHMKRQTRALASGYCFATGSPIRPPRLQCGRVNFLVKLCN
jgi:hypothetical protein